MANELFEKRSVNFSDRNESVMSNELYVPPPLPITKLFSDVFSEEWAGNSALAICDTVSHIRRLGRSSSLMKLTILTR